MLPATGVQKMSDEHGGDSDEEHMQPHGESQEDKSLDRGRSPDIKQKDTAEADWIFHCLPCQKRYQRSRSNDFGKHLISRHRVSLVPSGTRTVYDKGFQTKYRSDFRVATEEEVAGVYEGWRRSAASRRERNKARSESTRPRGRPSRSRGSNPGRTRMGGARAAQETRRRVDQTDQEPPRKKARLTGGRGAGVPSRVGARGADVVRCQALKFAKPRVYDLHPGWTPTVRVERMRSRMRGESRCGERCWKDTGYLRRPTVVTRVQEWARLRKARESQPRAPSPLSISSTDAESEDVRKLSKCRSTSRNSKRLEERNRVEFYRIPRRRSEGSQLMRHKKSVLPEVAGDTREVVIAGWRQEPRDRWSSGGGASRTSSGQRGGSRGSTRRARSRSDSHARRSRHDAYEDDQEEKANRYRDCGDAVQTRPSHSGGRRSRGSTREESRDSGERRDGAEQEPATRKLASVVVPVCNTEEPSKRNRDHTPPRHEADVTAAGARQASLKSTGGRRVRDEDEQERDGGKPKSKQRTSVSFRGEVA